MHIASGVIGGVVVLFVILRACAGSEGPSAPVRDAGEADARAAVATVPVDGASPTRDAAVTPDAALDPDDPAGAALLQAAERVSAHNLDGALRILAEAHKKFVANPDIPYMTGRLELTQGRYPEGVASLRAATRLFPGYLDDPELAKLVVQAFMSTPSRHAGLARFIHDDLGARAIPYLEDARDHAATPALRARAVAERKQLH